MWVCVSVSVIRPHAYLYLFFLSFWQLNARVFVKKTGTNKYQNWGEGARGTFKTPISLGHHTMYGRRIHTI